MEAIKVAAFDPPPEPAVSLVERTVAESDGRVLVRQIVSSSDIGHLSKKKIGRMYNIKIVR